MMKKVQLFNNPDFGEIRIIEIDDKLYFVGVDVARALGYKNTKDAIIRHCKGVVKHDLPTNGGMQQVNLITEGDLYRLIINSKLKNAEKFERWVFDEVLPTIRKHGAYMTPDKIEEAILNPDTIIQLATALKEEREKSKNLAITIEAQRPLVIFAESVAVSEDCILVRQLAKLLNQNSVDIGEKRLFTWLRENGYLINQKGRDHNLPTQYSMDLGLFRIKETSVSNSDGKIIVRSTPLVTGKGQQYFINKFKMDLAKV